MKLTRNLMPDPTEQAQTSKSILRSRSSQRCLSGRESNETASRFAAGQNVERLAPQTRGVHQVRPGPDCIMLPLSCIPTGWPLFPVLHAACRTLQKCHAPHRLHRNGILPNATANAPIEPRPSGSGITTKSPRRKCSKCMALARSPRHSHGRHHSSRSVSDQPVRPRSKRLENAGLCRDKVLHVRQSLDHNELDPDGG